MYPPEMEKETRVEKDQDDIRKLLIHAGIIPPPFSNIT